MRQSFYKRDGLELNLQRTQLEFPKVSFKYDGHKLRLDLQSNISFIDISDNNPIYGDPICKDFD